MKKKFTFIVFCIVVISANAQNKSLSSEFSVSNLQSYSPRLQIKSVATSGDTLFYFDGTNFSGSGISVSSVPPFNFRNDDVDGKNCATALNGSPFSPTSGFAFFYELMPTPGDTNIYMAANSWFNPVGVADDWFSVGPITIPAAGAHVVWGDVYNDPGNRNGYEVLVSTTGLVNDTDFTSPPISVIADNSVATSLDTAQWPNNQFVTRGASLMAYAGQDIYLAIHHNSSDMFIVDFDNLLVLEGPLGIEDEIVENGVKLFQNVPNPCTSVSKIDYELKNNSIVELQLFDLTGKLVASQLEGIVGEGRHEIELSTSTISAGLYSYCLKVNNDRTLPKKLVILK